MRVGSFGMIHSGAGDAVGSPAACHLEPHLALHPLLLLLLLLEVLLLDPRHILQVLLRLFPSPHLELAVIGQRVSHRLLDHAEPCGRTRFLLRLGFCCRCITVAAIAYQHWNNSHGLCVRSCPSMGFLLPERTDYVTHFKVRCWRRRNSHYCFAFAAPERGCIVHVHIF